MILTFDDGQDSQITEGLPDLLTRGMRALCLDAPPLGGRRSCHDPAIRTPVPPLAVGTTRRQPTARLDPPPQAGRQPTQGDLTGKSM